MEKYLFCTAKVRPPYCSKRSNLCCQVCEEYSDCLEEHIDSKIKPCAPDGDEEECPYNI